MTVKFIADIAVCLGHARRDINQFLSFFFLLLTFSLIVIDSNVILVYVIFLFFFSNSLFNSFLYIFQFSFRI